MFKIAEDLIEKIVNSINQNELKPCLALSSGGCSSSCYGNCETGCNHTCTENCKSGSGNTGW